MVAEDLQVALGTLDLQDACPLRNTSRTLGNWKEGERLSVTMEMVVELVLAVGGTTTLCDAKPLAAWCGVHILGTGSRNGDMAEIRSTTSPRSGDWFQEDMSVAVTSHIFVVDLCVVSAGSLASHTLFSGSEQRRAA